MIRIEIDADSLTRDLELLRNNDEIKARIQAEVDRAIDPFKVQLENRKSNDSEAPQ